MKVYVQWIGLGKKNYITVCRKISFHRMRFFGNVQLGKGSAAVQTLCRWGCGVVLEDGQQEMHEATECTKCFVKCPLGCDEGRLWRQDLKLHMTKICKNRQQKCEQCKEMVVAGNMA